jgi:predicted acetyltransferase
MDAVLAPQEIDIRRLTAHTACMILEFSHEQDHEGDSYGFGDRLCPRAVGNACMILARGPGRSRRVRPSGTSGHPFLDHLERGGRRRWKDRRVSAELPQVRPLSSADEAEFFDLDRWAFGYDSADADLDAARELLEEERLAGVRLGDPPKLVGIHAALTQDLTVPGGSVRCGGLTWVAVHPEARRRGVLRAMMRHHLDDLRERGEPVSALFAAEPAIYGRFGYGLTSSWVELTVPRGAALRDVPGAADLTASFETADRVRHGPLVADLFERARANHPGWVSRSRGALWASAFLVPASTARGQDDLRLLTVRDRGGDVRGYALFTRRMDWSATGANGTVSVREAITLDGAAAYALWSRLLDLDLTARVEVRRRPVDDVLLHLLVDVRAADPRFGDALWVRIVDLPTALAARRYPAPVEVVLDVADALCPWNAGRWRLKSGPDGASCEPADAEADLALDVRDLASAYLGGVSLTALASAGLVRELRPGALIAAAAAFSWPVAPYCGWLF